MRALFMAGVMAGVLAGVIVTVVQLVEVVPLIHAAEVYEMAAEGTQASGNHKIETGSDGIARQR